MGGWRPAGRIGGCGLALWLLGCPATGLAGGGTRLALSPADMRAETHSRALGLRITGTYRQLAGTLAFDPLAGTCHIDVVFASASLSAPNALLRAEIMAPDFLDPSAFPETRYVGDCQGGRLLGRLTLRGQTHPFDMAFGYSGGPARPVAIHAQGVLDRMVWGVDGLRLTVGRNIGITDDISLAGALPAGG